MNDDIMNFFRHENFLDLSKLKAFGDNKLYVVQMIDFVFERIENIMGNGEIRSY